MKKGKGRSNIAEEQTTYSIELRVDIKIYNIIYNMHSFNFKSTKFAVLKWGGGCLLDILSLGRSKTSGQR